MTAPAGFQPFSAQAVWSLGNPDAPDVSFNGVDGFGVEWVIADPVGWYQTPAVELGLEDRPTDGSWFGRGAFKARVLEMSGAIRACTGDPYALDDALGRLSDALSPSVDTVLAHTGGRVPKQVTVRQSGELTYPPLFGMHRRVRQFAFVLTAADPFKYAAGAAGAVAVPLALLNPASVTGLAHPLAHPANHGGSSGVLGGRANTTNPGLPVAPVVTITGPVVNPVVSNASTGQSFGLSYSLAAGETAVIDMGLRMVLVSGISRLALKAPRSQFWALGKGANDLRFTAAAYSAAATATVTYRPRWK